MFNERENIESAIKKIQIWGEELTRESNGVRAMGSGLHS